MSAAREAPIGLPRGTIEALDAAVDGGVCSGAALGITTVDGRMAVACRGLTATVPHPGEAVTTATYFDLASLTKPMVTTTLIAQELCRSGSVWGLDRPLAALLPQARGTVLGGATVRQLMGHASGAQAWSDLASQTAVLEAPADRRSAIMRRVLASVPGRRPGVQAVYSDLGFLALGWALEVTCGASLDRLFADRIAGPAGLSSARFSRMTEGQRPLPVCATEVQAARCADGLPLAGVVHDDNCAALDGVAGHAGLFAPLPDVLRWAAGWLQTTAATGRPWIGIAPEIARELVEAAAAPDTTWRLGWDTPSPGMSSAGATAPTDAFGHLGFTGTSVWIAPSLGLAVVLLTNRVHPTRWDTAGIRRLRPAVHEAIWRAARGANACAGDAVACAAEGEF